MIRALFKFSPIPMAENQPLIVIDTTSGSGDFRELSPFVLPSPPAKRFENLWQFSKVYKEHLDDADWMTVEWYQWQKKGFDDTRAHRYPMGKGAIPKFTYWNDSKLGYIDARKQLYAVEYASNVQWTSAYQRLENTYAECCRTNKDLILLDYDAYDHIQLGMSLIDVINEPKRKMGHAFVLIMMLTGLLEECVNSESLLKQGIEIQEGNNEH
jgi:hypothetical protein